MHQRGPKGVSDRRWGTHRAVIGSLAVLGMLASGLVATPAQAAVPACVVSAGNMGTSRTPEGYTVYFWIVNFANTPQLDPCTWKVPANVSSIDVYVVGGGGGGAGGLFDSVSNPPRLFGGNGGGGGQVVFRSGLAVTPNSDIPIDVGAGGAGGTAGGGGGGNGQTTTFGNISASGGKGGDAYTNSTAVRTRGGASGQNYSVLGGQNL